MRGGAVLLALALLAGCGGDEERSASTPPPRTTTTTTATTPAPAPTTTTPAPATTTPPPPASAPGPESQPGGAGDEQAPRVPVVFTLRAGTLAPPQVSVPAFFRIELTVRNEDDERHVVAVRGQRDLPVEGRSTSRRIVAGLRKGSYAVRVDGEAAGVLVSGLEPGP